MPALPEQAQAGREAQTGREALFALFDAHAIAHATLEHPPVFRVGEGEAVQAALPGAHTKNLFLKDAKGRLWLICALGETAIDLRRLPGVIGSARLSFGSAGLMAEILGVTPGSVTPFALMNDRERRVSLVLDKALAHADPINFHPLSNAATTTVSQEGFRRFLDVVGAKPEIVDFSALRPAAVAAVIAVRGGCDHLAETDGSNGRRG